MLCGFFVPGLRIWRPPDVDLSG